MGTEWVVEPPPRAAGNAGVGNGGSEARGGRPCRVGHGSGACVAFPSFKLLG